VTAQTPFIPRAPRYQIGILLRYRPIGEPIWREGRSENISRTGVLFSPERVLSVHTHIELMLEMPAEVAASTGVHLRRGRVVRAIQASHLEDSPPYAAAVFEFDYTHPPDPLDPRRI